MAYFSLFGDRFNIDEVTAKLKVTPTRTAQKGDVINEKHRIKETSWTLGTEYEESLDVNEQLKKVWSLLRDKVNEINSIQTEHRLKSKFFVVIIIEEGLTPALYLDADFIKFAGLIHAEIDVDLYANPYNDSE